MDLEEEERLVPKINMIRTNTKGRRHDEGEDEVRPKEKRGIAKERSLPKEGGCDMYVGLEEEAKCSRCQEWQ